MYFIVCLPISQFISRWITVKILSMTYTWYVNRAKTTFIKGEKNASFIGFNNLQKTWWSFFNLLKSLLNNLNIFFSNKRHQHQYLWYWKIFDLFMWHNSCNKKLYDKEKLNKHLQRRFRKYTKAISYIFSRKNYYTFLYSVKKNHWNFYLCFSINSLNSR